MIDVENTLKSFISTLEHFVEENRKLYSDAKEVLNKVLLENDFGKKTADGEGIDVSFKNEIRNKFEVADEFLSEFYKTIVATGSGCESYYKKLREYLSSNNASVPLDLYTKLYKLANNMASCNRLRTLIVGLLNKFEIPEESYKKCLHCILSPSYENGSLLNAIKSTIEPVVADSETTENMPQNVITPEN